MMSPWRFSGGGWGFSSASYFTFHVREQETQICKEGVAARSHGSGWGMLNSW